EQAIDRVFDGPGMEQAASAAQPFALPSEDPIDLHLTFNPSFELLAFECPVSTYYAAWKADHKPIWPDPQEQFVALLRRDYVVRRYELTGVQHALLRSLRDGQTLEGSLLAAAAQWRTSIDDLAMDVRDWFTKWSAEQFFVLRSG